MKKGGWKGKEGELEYSRRGRIGKDMRSCGSEMKLDTYLYSGVCIASASPAFV